MKLDQNEIWIPKKIGYSMGEPIVELVRLLAVPESFFSDLDIGEYDERVRMPLMDINIQRVGKDIDPKGILFHLPRSGSTLIARILSALPGNVVVVEPEAINALLSHSFGAKNLKVIWLRQLIQIYGASFRASGQNYFIKTSSWNILFAHFFSDAFRGVPMGVVYRDLIEVMVQILERPTGWMADNARSFMLGESVQGKDDMNLSEYCLCVLERFLLIIEQHKSSIKMLDYGRFPNLILDDLRNCYDIQVNAGNRHELLEITQLDSEDWLGETIFEPDSHNLKRQAPSILVEQINERLEPILSRIKS